MKFQYEKGDQVILIEDWTWQNRSDYGVTPVNRRPRKGTIGTVVHHKGSVTVDFSEATGNKDFKTLSTDSHVVAPWNPVTDEEIKAAIASILKPNV